MTIIDKLLGKNSVQTQTLSGDGDGEETVSVQYTPEISASTEELKLINAYEIDQETTIDNFEISYDIDTLAYKNEDVANIVEAIKDGNPYEYDAFFY